MGQTHIVVRRLCTVMIQLLMLAVTVFAQQQEVEFVPPQDIALVWAKRIALLMIVVAITLILHTLIFHRHRLMEHRAKWFLFVGICVLPIPALFVSIGVGLEQSKDVTFCNSCHTMDPFFDDMNNMSSPTLAALHYRNRYIQREHCWTCHSDYGIFGTAEAKMDGLKHVYRYTFRTYRLPIRMRHSYDLSICLNCHAESALFRRPRNDPEAHEGVLESVLKNEMSCLTCHELAHPPGEERSGQ